MKKAALIILILFFMSSPIFSQDWTGEGRQSGFVYDMEGNPLEGVKVKLFFTKTQSGFEVKTNAKGKWVAFGVKGGTWNADFEMQGYMPKRIAITIKDYKQKNPVLKINLEKMEGLYVSDELKEDFVNGNKLYEEGKYEEAINIFNDVIAEFPDAYVVNLSIANCHFQMEKYDEAEKFYKMVLEKDATNIDVLMGIGNCYSNRGDNEKALEWYGKIEFEKIKDQTVLFNIGTIYYNNSKYEEALKFYKRAVEIQEDFLDAIYQLGLAYLTLGNNESALSEFEDYLKYDPDSERAAQVKGFIDFLKKETPFLL